METGGLTVSQQKQFDLVSFRVSWSQAVLFGCYEVRRNIKSCVLVKILF